MSTYTNFKIETDADGIALVTWDMPEKSMNVFTAEVMEELNAIVDATVADAAVSDADHGRHLGNLEGDSDGGGECIRRCLVGANDLAQLHDTGRRAEGHAQHGLRTLGHGGALVDV